jgi:pseudouridine synthase
MASGRPRQRTSKSLDRVLSRSGLGSRARAAEWIRGGRVTVGGRLVRDPDRRIDAESADVRLDGRRVRAGELLYYAFHKPSGVLTSFGDPEGRKTIYDVLPPLDTWLAPVGRLDRDTSGLLLLTNDSRFAARITDPDSRIEKTYRVRTARPIDDGAIERLRDGLELADGPTLPARVEIVARYKSYAVLDLAIVEGRNRQVRRMLAAVGNRVSKLKRIALGPLTLEGLASGELRPLESSEVRALVPDR